MINHALEVINLSFSYEQGEKAINNISFTIAAGESVGIIGANGAGKSTLLMLLMGILTPTNGEILVENIKIDKNSLSSIRKKLGMVFQNSDDQLFMNTVYDDIAFGPRNYNLDEVEVDKRVVNSLELVGINHLKDKAPFKLSGGEKRCAAIATVLSMNPSILIMDEPTSSLDPKARRQLINLLNTLPQTKLITSHDLDMILDTCNRIIIISNGKIIADGPTSKTIFNKELLESSGLEMPLSLQKCPICAKNLYVRL